MPYWQMLNPIMAFMCHFGPLLSIFSSEPRGTFQWVTFSFYLFIWRLKLGLFYRNFCRCLSHGGGGGEQKFRRWGFFTPSLRCPYARLQFHHLFGNDGIYDNCNHERDCNDNSRTRRERTRLEGDWNCSCSYLPGWFDAGTFFSILFLRVIFILIAWKRRYFSVAWNGHSSTWIRIYLPLWTINTWFHNRRCNARYDVTNQVYFWNWSQALQRTTEASLRTEKIDFLLCMLSICRLILIFFEILPTLSGRRLSFLSFVLSFWRLQKRSLIPK